MEELGLYTSAFPADVYTMWRGVEVGQIEEVFPSKSPFVSYYSAGVFIEVLVFNDQMECEIMLKQ